MDNWIKDLWNKNKLFFILLLPVVLLVVFKDVVSQVLLASARKISNDAKKKDSGLKDEVDALNQVADKLKNEANAKPDTSDVDVDWYKK